MDISRDEMNNKLKNWHGGITQTPAVIARPRSEQDLINILADSQTYPAPIRPMGSNHSVTPCSVATAANGQAGTVVDMTSLVGECVFNETNNTVTASAGMRYYDLNKVIKQHGQYQLFVNTEIGDVTLGAAACGATKDSSVGQKEFGQICAYVVGMRLVKPNGEIVDITDERELYFLRCSYGLFGVVSQVTIKKIV